MHAAALAVIAQELVAEEAAGVWVALAGPVDTRPIHGAAGTAIAELLIALRPDPAVVAYALAEFASSKCPAPSMVIAVRLVQAEDRGDWTLAAHLMAIGIARGRIAHERRWTVADSGVRAVVAWCIDERAVNHRRARSAAVEVDCVDKVVFSDEDIGKDRQIQAATANECKACKRNAA